MNEEPAKKCRRFDAPSADRDAPPSAACIHSLPDAVLQYCFSFIGPGHYRYIAGSCRWFREVYCSKHERKTTWARAALSVSSAELCLEDARETSREAENASLGLLVTFAVKIGNVIALEWARTKKGYEFNTDLLCLAGLFGHLCVIKWAQAKHLEWYSEQLVNAAAMEGHVGILEWIHNAGRSVLPETTPSVAAIAAFNGQVAVLSWMKERDMLGTGKELWNAASCNGHVGVLEYLLDSGYEPYGYAVMLNGITCNHLAVLTFARDHGIGWDEDACLNAALDGNLPILKWLRENDCPWDVTVIRGAQEKGHDDIVEWATENGCPVE